MAMGMQPDQFWRMQPWHTALYIKTRYDRLLQDRDHGAWLMWHGAALTRMKKIPDISRFLSKAMDKVKEETKKTLSPEKESVILGWLQGAKAAHEEKQNEPAASKDSA